MREVREHRRASRLHTKKRLLRIGLGKNNPNESENITTLDHAKKKVIRMGYYLERNRKVSIKAKAVLASP